MMRSFRWFAVLGISGVLGATSGAAQAPRSFSDSAFAALIVRLSEPSGYFDTDNLISNEDSYLHPVTTLRRLGIVGGTYLGVGPDQNFSYIAAIRPNVAFIVDIRRDNLLEHLLFKAIFAQSRNRFDYLSLLFGHLPPADSTGWGARRIDSLLTSIERLRPDSSPVNRARIRIHDQVRRLGVPLSEADLATISRFHGAFVRGGPALQFNSFGRAPQPYYPDFRRLAREKDLEGREASFLGSESAFRVVKDLHARNVIIPVVGNFGGNTALAEIAKWMAEHGERMSAFYTSNVEQYLYRDGGFAEFAASVERIPRRNQALFIRSCFVCRGEHLQRVAGYNSVQLVQSVEAFITMRKGGQLQQYFDLVNALPPPSLR
jgi:hypothetical protein